LPNVCDFQKENHTLRYGFKNLKKIYSLFYSMVSYFCDFHLRRNRIDRAVEKNVRKKGEEKGGGRRLYTCMTNIPSSRRKSSVS
jgi:hypothetical protein